ncbi:MAG: CHASE domain-containing protein [Chloroflexi bacterium]|nr:CHASE domain-containing protein [Chloroflexota bacterium]
MNFSFSTGSRRASQWASDHLLPARDALLFLLLNLLLTVVAWHYASQAVEARDRARFDEAVRTTQVAVSNRLDQYIDVLRGARGLLTASQLVGRAEWASYVNSIEVGTRYPGIEELGYCERLWPDGKDLELAKFRSQGIPNLALWPDGDRPEYFPVLLLEPVDARSSRVYGYDAFTDPVRRAAMEQARDKGLPAATARVVPLEGEGENAQARFAVYLPFYRTEQPLGTVEQRRTALIGFVYAQLRVEDLLRGIPGDEAHPQIAVEVFDGPVPSREQLLFGHDQLSGSANPLAPSVSFTRTASLDIAGRPWTLRFSTLPPFEENSQRSLPTLVLLGGLAVSLLLFAVGLARAEARTAAGRMTDERKRLEDQLRQAQKMEAVGRLAGGVAHDFNNLLTVVTGFSELLLQQLEHHDPRRAMVEEISKAGDRGSALTRQLLAFSRRQILAPEVMDLNTVIAGMQPMLRLLIGEDVELATVLDPRLGRVKADRGQIEQVVMNLATNARDAMPQGGKLTLETANVDLDASYSTKHFAVEPGPYVMLAVSDTGCGMDHETQERIFEPFFTTKPKGKGTGLGLASVFGIVQQSGGHIRAYSEPGWGTTFKIYLPVIDEPVVAVGSRITPGDPACGSETILLVEDEELVRSLARRILQSNGYQVLEAARGEDALRLCKTHAGPIHLVITDVVMPGMSGRELAEQLRYFRTETKVLYMSGYTDDDMVRRGVLQEEMAFLQKPFKPEALLNRVRRMLDENTPGAIQPAGEEPRIGQALPGP